LFNGENTSASTNITVGDNFTIAFWTNPDSPNMRVYASVMSTATIIHLAEDFKLIIVVQVN